MLFPVHWFLINPLSSVTVRIGYLLVIPRLLSSPYQRKPLPLCSSLTCTLYWLMDQLGALPLYLTPLTGAFFFFRGFSRSGTLNGESLPSQLLSWASSFYFVSVASSVLSLLTGLVFSILPSVISYNWCIACYYDCLETNCLLLPLMYQDFLRMAQQTST